MVLQTIRLHGHEVSYRRAGHEGPVVLLIHGMAGSCATWEPVLDGIGQRAQVIAPDLLGHGGSAKPRGDYSIGAFASGLRDLLIALGHERATVVGHSLGGGVAMQFAYQFPELTERLVLVASGGLGPEVNPVLRFCAAPGAEVVLPLFINRHVSRVAGGVRRRLARLPFRVMPPQWDEIARSYTSLMDGTSRTAFLHTLRSGVDMHGQRIDARDRLHLAASLPVLIVWGARDRIIPLRHGTAAHDVMPDSRLVVFPDAGHYPHVHDPERFTRALIDFIGSTAPARLSARDLRDQITGQISAAGL